MDRRNYQHNNSKESSVYQYIRLSKLKPKLILKSDYIEDIEAVKLEREVLNDYVGRGWKSLNKFKTGSLGSNIIKWDKNRCIDEIKKYKRLVDFQINSGPAYVSCRKNGWTYLFDVLEKRTPRGYFNNKELCEKESKKYNNRSDFMKNCWSAWYYSKINGWLDDFFN